MTSDQIQTSASAPTIVPSQPRGLHSPDTRNRLKITSLICVLTHIVTNRVIDGKRGCEWRRDDQNCEKSLELPKRRTQFLVSDQQPPPHPLPLEFGSTHEHSSPTKNIGHWAPGPMEVSMSQICIKRGVLGCVSAVPVCFQGVFCLRGFLVAFLRGRAVPGRRTVTELVQDLSQYASCRR